ncbi:hypothetical protein JNUCC74_15235 [Cerasibacillus sp. JNUCC 74]
MKEWIQLPDIRTIIYIILAFLIPYLISKINMKMRKYGDPPWKKEEERTKN